MSLVDSVAANLVFSSKCGAERTVWPLSVDFREELGLFGEIAAAESVTTFFHPRRG